MIMVFLKESLGNQPILVHKQDELVVINLVVQSGEIGRCCLMRNSRKLDVVHISILHFMCVLYCYMRLGLLRVMEVR